MSDPAHDPTSPGIRCRACGYDLRTHSPDATCPECGAAVRLSLPLRYSQPQWLDKLISGASLFFACNAAAALMWLLGAVWNTVNYLASTPLHPLPISHFNNSLVPNSILARPYFLSRPLGLITETAAMAISVLGVVGVFRYTSANRLAGAVYAGEALRRWIRISWTLAIAWLPGMLTIVPLLSINSSTTFVRSRGLLMMPVDALCCVSLILQVRYLRSLAAAIPWEIPLAKWLPWIFSLSYAGVGITEFNLFYGFGGWRSWSRLLDSVLATLRAWYPYCLLSFMLAWFIYNALLFVMIRRLIEQRNLAVSLQNPIGTHDPAIPATSA